MKIEALSLTNFRNIAALTLHPHESVNIIYGDNAQGKTNLIEAIWLLTGAKSFRGARDADLIAFGSDHTAVSAEFYRENRMQSATLLFGAKKQATLNEIALPSVTGLAGIFCAVVFSPAHLGLIQDGPGERRRFADGCIGQISPRYVSLTADYARTLLQRNSLLKDISYSASLLDTLEIWDEKLASLASLMVKNRAKYIEKMARYACEIYRGIALEKESITIRYQTAGIEYDGTPDGYRRSMLEALTLSRAEDIRLGSTSVGPHRDDISFELGGVGMRSFASQGQQRSAVLALKLAESRLTEELLDEKPVILLDDVMSELDQKRQDYLLHHLGGNQVFITCCDRSCFASLHGGSIFGMDGGGITGMQSF